MNHGEIADARFHEGCNCAQAVFTAFCDVTGLSRPEAMRLSSSFGGGVGRMREICGALSGAFLVLGWLYGYEEPGDDSVKAAHYARVQELAAAFRKQNGSIVCREIKGVDTGVILKSCDGCVEEGCRLVEKLLEEKGL